MTTYYYLHNVKLLQGIKLIISNDLNWKFLLYPSWIAIALGLNLYITIATNKLSYKFKWSTRVNDKLLQKDISEDQMSS